jgi:hypothetical protein
MYQPILNNIEPSLIARGYEGVADFQLKGAQAMAAGISSAGNSVAGGIAAAADAWRKSAAQSGQNAGMLDTYSRMNDAAMQSTGKPIVDPQYLAQVAGEKNQDKVSGALMSLTPMFDSYLSLQRQLAVANATNGFTPSARNVGGQTYVETEPGSWQRSAPEKKGPEMFGVQMPQGINIYGGMNAGGQNAGGQNGR